MGMHAGALHDTGVGAGAGAGTAGIMVTVEGEEKNGGGS